MSNTKNFFKNKKDWSLLKDTILDNYLTPYIAKILYTKRPTIIIDCFAGKGKFDDGSLGSPCIIGNHIQIVIENPSYSFKNIKAVFIEKKYYRELLNNIDSYKNCEVIKGTFEENIKSIDQFDKSHNIFVYVDPYGIKSLDFNLFQQIKNKNFNSLELLMNLNSFGFLREGCRLLKYEYDICTTDKEEMDYETDDSNTIENMNKIAYGEYWQNILNDFNTAKIDMRTAEELFCREYTSQMKGLFKHIVNIPIKTKTNNIPKYRLIFGTNHKDGLILMSDEMNKAWNKFLEIERKGQGELFEYDYPEFLIRNTHINDDDLIKTILNQFVNKKNIEYKELIVSLINKFGISFPQKKYNEILKKMENSLLEIVRIDKKTGMLQQSSSFDTKKYEIMIKEIK